MKRTARPAGFTLVELLISTSITIIMVLLLVTMTHQASTTWRAGETKAEQFRQARTAFDQMTRRLGQATLNTHWDYEYAADDPKKERPPIAYVRQTRLRFRSGRMDRLAQGKAGVRPTHGVFFQAPLGKVEDDDYDNLDRLLNTTGYFLEVGDERPYVPHFLHDTAPIRIRSRLMEMVQPTEKLKIYQLELGKPDDTWFGDALVGETRPVHVLAENVVALVIQPTLSQADETARAAEGKKALSPNFDYDSTLTSNHEPPLSPADPDINPKNQLPPIIRVYMFAIDEDSAQRLQEQSHGDPSLGLQLDGLFQDASRLDGDPTATDLALFEKQLLDRRLKYRLFSTSVSLRGAKWSRSQTL